MISYARGARPGLETANPNDDISLAAGSMAELRAEGVNTGQSLEETPASPRDGQGA